MNREQLKKCIGFRMQLEPVACRLDDLGRELPSESDEWIVENVTDEGVRISSSRGYATTLGLDHIHHYTTNPDKSTGELNHGFLTLHVQIFMQGSQLWVRPNFRPGERVAPQPIQVHEKWVDFRYPRDSGLQAKLEGNGYSVTWCMDSHLARRTDLEGWSVIIEPDNQGIPCKYRLKDRPADQTLIKKKNA